MDSRAVVDEFLRNWLAQDIEGTVATGAEDIVFALHISNDALPFGGETHGRDACRSLLYTILADFDYLRYEPVVLGEEDGVVRVQVSFHYHHRRTGENLIGTKRLVFKVRDGLIVRLDEYHDAGFVEAFMRLVRHREARNEIVKPPKIPKALKRVKPNRTTLRSKVRARVWQK